MPPRSRRFAVAVVCGLALVAVAALVVYPYANADETPPRWHRDERTAARSRLVTVPALATVRESQLTAPALLEPPAARPAPAKAAALPAPGGQRNVSPRRVAPVIEQPPTGTAAPDPIVTDARPADPPPAQPTRAPAPPDPWQPLREALALCSTSGGVFERAICEQRARLLHCDGYWGHVASCPDGRREYGQ